MNAEMWEELKKWLYDGPVEKGVPELWILDKMREIKHRTLPERVAEILENIDFFKLSLDGGNVPDIERNRFRRISKALRTGDLSEIKKWVKDERG